MDYQQIRYEIEDRILTLTLNRPDRMNAYTEVMRAELVDAIGLAEADDNVRVIIVTGAGRAFCAGMDLGEAGTTFDYTGVAQNEHRDGGGILALRIYRSTKPIIAAINGAAVGVGLTMTLPMDIRIAANTAKMGIVFARRGIAVDACSSWFLPRVVGISKAVEWSMTGRVFSAQEAFQSGLVSQLVEPGQVIPAARAIASEIARYSAPVSVALIRQMMWSMLGAAHPMDAHRIESQGFHWLGQRADAAEGINAFLEKREPRFTMSPYSDMPDFYPWLDEPPFKLK